MFEKNNFKVIQINKNDINGASKQYYLCHNDSLIPDNNKSINKELKLEKKMNLSKVQTFKNFIKIIDKSKIQLNKLLKKVNKQGKTIHCYGASTKGNVLLQYYKINNKIINYAAERNKNKYNLFTPGTKIKIISEKYSRFLKPDYYLVLPWHFKNEILKRERKIRAKGTKFIFPLPNLKVF